MARVLIVDDSAAMRAKLKSMLLQLGHEVVGEAANGLQASREYEKSKPDVVTMDITMPIMDGILAVQRILEVFPNANIIMVSSLAQKHMILKALENGAKHYIIKPLEIDNLSKIIGKVLEESKNAASLNAGNGDMSGYIGGKGTAESSASTQQAPDPAQNFFIVLPRIILDSSASESSI